MAGLQAPLSTLRLAPHGALRMTRGQPGLLFLHCCGFSPFTLCRSPGALTYDFFRFVWSPLLSRDLFCHQNDTRTVTRQIFSSFRKSLFRRCGDQENADLSSGSRSSCQGRVFTILGTPQLDNCRQLTLEHYLRHANPSRGPDVRCLRPCCLMILEE